MLAPSPFLEANLHVLYCASVEARLMGWQGVREHSLSEKECRRLAALMDVIHNIPALLQRWDTVDEPKHREFFRQHDAKWGSESTFKLLTEYESKLRAV